MKRKLITALALAVSALPQMKLYVEYAADIYEMTFHK